MSRKFSFILYAIAVAVAFLFAVLTFPGQAKAMTILGNEMSCTTMSQDVEYAVQMRDGGWPWAGVGEMMVDQFVAASLAEPGATYIRDDDDAKFFRYIMKYVWTAKGQPPEQLAKSVYQYCMQHGV